MEDDRRIGMIQPLTPAEDNLGPVAADPERPPLYDVGCVGEIVECEPQSDGRYWIVLRGESRFRVVEELAMAEGGYRQVLADRSDYASDLDELDRDLEIGQFLAVADQFRSARGLDFDMDLLASLPAAQAVNALCAALPLEPAEKQALLEAAGLETRRDLLAGLLEMQLTGLGWVPRQPYSGPMVN
jgi:Lon protease-like protein